MRIAILAPRLPPDVDGVGDHAVRIATAFGPGDAVWLLTESAEAPDRFRYGDSFGPEAATLILGFLEEKRTEVLLVEYVPFLYARSGISPALAGLVRKAGIPVLLVVHEPCYPLSAHPVRALRSILQRMQLKSLAEASARVVATCDAWAGMLAPWCGSPPVMIPVGSNIPRAPCSAGERSAMRARLGIPEGSPACAYFGSAHPSHLMPWVARALERLPDLHLVVIGPASEAWPGPASSRLRRLGRLPAVEASRVLQACDLQAAPFADGISARRSSAMAGLAHGLAVASTRGRLTDPSLPWEEGAALSPVDEAAFLALLQRLATDPAARIRQGRAGAAFHRTHLDEALLSTRYVGLAQEGIRAPARA